MPIFYKGAGIGTWWHDNDARRTGFQPWTPAPESDAFTVHRIMHHVARATTTSPFISLTRSYEVARSYALVGRQPPPLADDGLVYEIEIDDASAVRLLDPVKLVAAELPEPYQTAYQHDGAPEFLLGVVAPKHFRRFLRQSYGQPPGGLGTERPPGLSIQVETLVRALRDAEILVYGSIPASCVKARIPIR